MKKINEINYLFSQGIVPEEFNFKLENKPLFDFKCPYYFLLAKTVEMQILTK